MDATAKHRLFPRCICGWGRYRRHHYGVGKYLKKRDPSTKIHPLEPAESPTLSTGYKVGSHRIQGISDEFIPAIVKLHEVDDVIQQGNYFEPGLRKSAIFFTPV